MPEEDGKIFGEAYRIYEKWRSVEIDSPEEWIMITQELQAFVARNPANPLALRLATGIMDTLDDLYRNGKKPQICSYTGRSDL